MLRGTLGRGRGAAARGGAGRGGQPPQQQNMMPQSSPAGAVGGTGFVDTAIASMGAANPTGTNNADANRPQNYDAIEGKDVLSNMYVIEGEEASYDCSPDDRIPPAHATSDAAHEMIMAALSKST